MARILICGTLAYDVIGRFDAPLEPATRNVKLERLDEGFGGCAMNMAYNLAQLGHEAVPLVYVGPDFEPAYAEHVRRAGIGATGIVRETGSRCARGIVLTGSDGAQFTAFYPGPSGLDRVARDLRQLIATHRFAAAILAPDLPEKTLLCAAGLAGIPLRVWCPGQYAEHTDPADAARLAAAVDLIIANRHEWQALFGTTPRSLPPRARIVVTEGPEPVLAMPDDLAVPVPPVPTSERNDPTGCGDAFAAALTAALIDGRPLAEAIRAGIDLAGRCLRRPGAQNH